jgi:methionyl-tRNA formyltransferase
VKIVFLGTPAMAVPSLESLVRAGHDIVQVVTRADRPLGRSARLQPPPVKQAALSLELPVLQPKRVRSAAFVDGLAALVPDLLVVVAYGRILPRAVLDVAPHGAINVHFSLLPKYRGAAPVQWALAQGETATGVTTMQIDEGLDEGDVLLRRECAIEAGEHAPSLSRRLSALGAELLVETVERLGSLTPEPQDHDAASFAPLLSAADGAVDPGALTASEIAGRIRGFDPWPGVWLERAGKRLRLIEAVARGRTNDLAEPGTLLPLDEGALPLVCAGSTLLFVTDVQPEGKRAMPVADAVNGRQLAPGDRLLWLHRSSG